MIKAGYRPFVNQYYYADRYLSDRLTQNHCDTFGNDYKKPNLLICINVNGNGVYYLASKLLVDLHFTGDCQYVSLFRYDIEGNRIENITDWGLQQFVDHYADTTISKEDIFHYTYAVLHNPAYRKKYELNLKREFPRLPFYEDFHKWAAWGKTLMDLHIHYETVEPFDLVEHYYELKAEAKRQKEIFTKVEEPEAMYAVYPK